MRFKDPWEILQSSGFWEKPISKNWYQRKLFLFLEHVNMIKRVQTNATMKLNSAKTDKLLGFQIKLQKWVHVLNNKHKTENEFTDMYEATLS